MKSSVSARPWLCTGNIRAPDCFASVPANINGLAVSAIMLAGKFRTYATFWPSLLSAVRIVMVPMSFFEVSLLINPSL